MARREVQERRVFQDSRGNFHETRELAESAEDRYALEEILGELIFFNNIHCKALNSIQVGAVIDVLFDSKRVFIRVLDTPIEEKANG